MENIILTVTHKLYYRIIAAGGDQLKFYVTNSVLNAVSKHLQGPLSHRSAVSNYIKSSL